MSALLQIIWGYRSMNRIDQMFETLKQKQKKALITFITAGDPDLNVTKEAVIEMEKNGADLVELGVPFSDPVAEGPVIQAANIRSLKAGTQLDRIFTMVRDLRQNTQIPLVFLMYYNSILVYGTERFFQNCAACGIDGIIIPDLPFEESSEIEEETQKYSVYQIQLLAPTSTPERIQKICAKAKGFLYCVSSLGVTGLRKDFQTDFEAMFEPINRYATVPTCIGFGISSPEQVCQLKGYSDGLIVGSAFVREIEKGNTAEEKIERVGMLAHQLKSAF